MFKGLPSEFTPYADELSNWLSSKIEGKSLRNRKYYVILKTDASSLSEESIRIDSEIVDTIAKSVSGAGKAKMPPEEIRKQAYDQLQEAKFNRRWLYRYGYSSASLIQERNTGDAVPDV